MATDLDGYDLTRTDEEQEEDEEAADALAY